MEHRGILIDTSIIIDFLRKEKKEKSLLWQIRETSVCFMSSITLFELLSGAKTNKQFEDINRIIKWIDSLSFNDYIAEVAASILRDLKSRNQLIDYRDIFIAATAMFHQLTLATLNISHFERIEGLGLLNISSES